MRFSPFFILLFLVISAYGQQTSVAVLPSDASEETKMSQDELDLLTENMREAALKVLPSNAFTVLDQNVVIKRLGGFENYVKECTANFCIVNLGKEAQVDYVGQARVRKIDGKFYLSVNLYNVNTEGAVAVLNYDRGVERPAELLAIVKKMVPTEVFGKIPGVAGGISGVQSTGGDYEFEGGKSYLESIRLKSNFGVLEIKPAYSDGIGKSEQWSLSINGKPASSWENKLSPGKYKVELSHRCYEALSFDAGINKDKREVFDMAGYAKPKKGGLILNAERDGKSVSEPVFVNGKQAGETPFSGSVPVCAKIEIGNGREAVDVNLKPNEKVTHTLKGVGGVSSAYLTDSRDGKMYKAVKIGKQIWMTENLNYNASGSKCYGSQESNCQKYGKLYDWNTAKTACPKGWHLPSDGEWTTLINFVGGSSAVGKKLRATSGWNSGSGEDKFEFAALPGGYGGSDGGFTNVGYDGFWWSASESGSYGAYGRFIIYNHVEDAGWVIRSKDNLFSVRCLQD